VCYQEWLKTQLMAINEYRLNLGKPEHHAVLAQLAAQFFSFTEVRAAAEEGASLSHLEKVWTPEKPNQ
jgi:Fe-S cluster biosynthesis and repair protein YggX